MSDPALTADRFGRQRAFANAHGFEAATLEPLPGDASFRRYSRLVGGPAAALVMDAPAPQEDLGQYLDVRRLLEGLGLRVPRLFAEDRSAGLAVIEDFGTATFTRVLAGLEGSACHMSEEGLYLLATDALAHLHAQTLPGDHGLRPYDMAALMREVMLFADYYAPAVGGSRGEAERSTFTDAWRTALAPCADDRSALVLRDYHVDNLMLLSGGDGIARCGQLDFQDALLGSPAYDLASLVEDARRDVSPAIRAAVLERYAERCGLTDSRDLIQHMTLLAAQRHTKVLGIFVRLYVRDGKRTYLQHLPRLVRLLDDALARGGFDAIRDATQALAPNWRTVPVF